MGKAQRRKQDRPLPAPAAPPRDVAGRGRAPAAAAPQWSPLLGPALIIAVGIICYANSFSIPFLFDDYFEIANNPAVKTLEPPLAYLTRSRGLTALSMALNYRSGGLTVWGFHLVNLAIHLANGVLVAALVRRTLTLPYFGDRYRAHAGTLATLVGLVFVVHPLQTMAVSYIVQRAESLAAFFYLATLLLVSGVASARSSAARGALWLAALLSAGLGVLSKEIVATVPLAALLYAGCFFTGERRPRRATLLAAGLVLAVPLAYALWLARLYLLPAAQHVDPSVPRTWMYIPTAGFAVEGISTWPYLLTQCAVILWYLRLFLLPTAQVFDYGWPFVDSPWRADVLLPLAVLLALVGVAIACVRRYRLATFCIAWVFLTLAPTSSVIPLRDAAFEHRMYLPVVGLAWLTVVGGADLLAWLAARQRRAPAAFWRAGGIAAALWIALLGAATVRRNQIMQDPLRLADADIAVAPDNWRSHFARAGALLERQQPDDAMIALEAAVRLGPTHGAPRVQLGNLYLQRRRYDDAERVLTPATELLEETVVAAALNQLAAVYIARGDDEAAEAALRRAAELRPGWASVQRQLGALYGRRGLWFGAAHHYNEAMRLSPSPALAPAAAEANLRAAATMLGQGKAHGAMSLLTKALRHDPSSIAARHYTAFVASSLGDWPRAVAEMQQVVAARPNDALARDNLERARAMQPLTRPPIERPLSRPEAAN